MPKKKTGLQKMGSMLAVLLLLSCTIFAQKTITGKVINKSDHQPIANATVIVRGALVGSQTDTSGTFSIIVPKDNSVLEISSIGFESVAISVSGKNSLGVIQLTSSSSTLNEVVVTGYTSQKRKDITAAV